MPLNSEMPLLRSYPQVGSLLWYMQRCINKVVSHGIIYNRTYKQLEVPIIDVFKLKYRFLYNKILCSQEKKGVENT